MLSFGSAVSGDGGDEDPVREGGCASLACACANGNAVLLVDRSAGVHVNGVGHGDGDVRVPKLHGNGRVRGAR